MTQRPAPAPIDPKEQDIFAVAGGLGGSESSFVSRMPGFELTVLL